MPRPPRVLRAFRPRLDALEALNHVSSLLVSLPVPAGTPSAGTGEAPPPASREVVRPIRSDTSLTYFDPRHHPKGLERNKCYDLVIRSAVLGLMV